MLPRLINVSASAAHLSANDGLRHQSFGHGKGWPLQSSFSFDESSIVPRNSVLQTHNAQQALVSASQVVKQVVQDLKRDLLMGH
jgi:hypothetical protein